MKIIKILLNTVASSSNANNSQVVPQQTQQQQQQQANSLLLKQQQQINNLMQMKNLAANFAKKVDLSSTNTNTSTAVSTSSKQQPIIFNPHNNLQHLITSEQKSQQDLSIYSSSTIIDRPNALTGQLNQLNHLNHINSNALIYTDRYWIHLKKMFNSRIILNLIVYPLTLDFKFKTKNSFWKILIS